MIRDDHAPPFEERDLIGDYQRGLRELHSAAQTQETRRGAQCKAEAKSEAWRVLLMRDMAHTP
jgi:hypothetical protein